ncbi:hypothetical protein KL86DES1_20506 [uncultured Desulfovibrio sp.]|uniref:Uncharacterized protein n=1 Tax=uncultured Desulfovibrio sp. TaxID=167968 RepID=A0A212L408_9BACT|nr:hypothetical protein KL86DES1_20506 [uncultured Desulfovibrio sp.]
MKLLWRLREQTPAAKVLAQRDAMNYFEPCAVHRAATAIRKPHASHIPCGPTSLRQNDHWPPAGATPRAALHRHRPLSS